MNYSELLKKCQKIELIVSEEQAKAVESATREQSNSKLWHRFRTGRITASKMKNVCNTDPTFPSQSLIKSICYPESYKFKSAATQWGCQHEKYAREIFFEKVKTAHENAKLEESGFFINPVVPFIGASPDGIFSCDCCGQATVEIKCPFCKRESTFDVAMSTDKKFYLQEETDKGQLTLDKNHSYYYQVQTQLGVTKLDLAYFVVWTEKDLHIEQITFDSEMWNEMCAKSKHIFVTAILPELIGKFYSRLPNTNILSASACNSSRSGESETSSCNTNEELWCFCNQVESGRMICCDNDKCKLKWFHYLCLGISCAPRGKWYCPDCRKLSQFQSKCGKKPAK
ncbi:hypothetical protein ACJMK2_003223 [Sinanodonta woodiana]|uniref:PHD-type domain-containing protein n=1 Tax=Sinanodonta woodiana TaxID=1069815 RepID=A0ABD3XXM2_SINWO